MHTQGQRTVTTYPLGGEPPMTDAEVLTPRTVERSAGGQPFVESRTSAQSAANVVTSRTELAPADHFDNPSKVDTWINELANYPDQLNYWQMTALNNKYKNAMKVADGLQTKALVAFKQSLHEAWDTSSNQQLNTLVRQSRVQYGHAMDFLQNPRAAKFELSDPEIYGGISDRVPSIEKDQLFKLVTKDLSPDGLQSLTEAVGPKK